MKRRRIVSAVQTAVALGVGLLAHAVATPAAAQGQNCGPRDRIVTLLRDRHGETRQAVGLQQNMQVMETYANSETGSWTIIVALPTGMACLVAAGEAWQAEAGSPAKKTGDEPA